MNELKPCPFCGVKPIIKDNFDTCDNRIYQVRHSCLSFMDTVRTYCYPKKELAVEAWNRRAEPVPRPVKHERHGMGDYRCPNPDCNVAFMDGPGRTNYCGNCGQRLEWSEENKK